MPVISLLLVVLIPGDGFAGTLCGTVRDAQTSATIPDALVLTFGTDGLWAGYSAITETDGTFCIDPIPAGTYDLQVHVRDHLVGTLKNVEVTDGVTGVVVEGMPLPPIALSAFPNPARSGTRISFDAGGAERARVSIHDLRGRFVRGWTFDGNAGSAPVFTWDLRDHLGHEVPAGIYFLRLTTDSASVGRRLVRLR